jgi:hypothetical protein
LHRPVNEFIDLSVDKSPSYLQVSCYTGRAGIWFLP